MSHYDALDAVHRLADRMGLLVEQFDIDGEWHRCPVESKKKKNLSGTYCLSEMTLHDGRVVIVGMLNNFVSGVEERLTLDDLPDVSPQELAEARRRAREASEQAKLQKAALQEEVARKAQGIWDKLPEEGRAPYLDKKGVRAWGVRFSRGSIVVPARDAAGRIWTLQFIDPDGNKRFLSGGAKRGRFHLISCPEGTPHILGFAEGFATAATVREAFNIDVATCFDAGNLFPVAEVLRGEFPDRRFVFFADDDRYNGYPQAFIRQSDHSPAVQVQIDALRQVRPDVTIEVVADDDPRLKDKNKHHNTGVSKAVLAAAAFGGDVVIPRFKEATA